jgi:arylsulfatase A-like enzyme
MTSPGPRLRVALALLATLSLPSIAVAQTKPNVILVMSDDLGWGDVGFNGSTIARTPHLDEMAAHALRFTRFYAAAPVCSPTRGSAITGRHPYRYGVRFANVGHMRAEEVTLAEALRAQGYATGFFG